MRKRFWLTLAFLTLVSPAFAQRQWPQNDSLKCEDHFYRGEDPLRWIPYTINCSDGWNQAVTTDGWKDGQADFDKSIRYRYITYTVSANHYIDYKFDVKRPDYSEKYAWATVTMYQLVNGTTFRDTLLDSFGDSIKDSRVQDGTGWHVVDWSSSLGDTRYNEYDDDNMPSRSVTVYRVGKDEWSEYVYTHLVLVISSRTVITTQIHYWARCTATYEDKLANRPANPQCGARSVNGSWSSRVGNWGLKIEDPNYHWKPKPGQQ
jgi:hypothetical protein